LYMKCCARKIASYLFMFGGVNRAGCHEPSPPNWERNRCHRHYRSTVVPRHSLEGRASVLCGWRWRANAHPMLRPATQSFAGFPVMTDRS
jgi:hypothetical protein